MLTGSRPTLLIIDDYYTQPNGNPMAQANEVLIDLDNLDSIDLATVEAAPEFIEPPAGRYKLGLQAKVEEYEKDEKDDEGDKTGEKVKAKRIRFTYDIQEVLELKDKKELLPVEGSLFSESFTVTPEGLRFFKTRAEAILGELGNAKISEVVTELNTGVSITADVKLRLTDGTDAEGNKRKYTNINVHVLQGHQKANL